MANFTGANVITASDVTGYQPDAFGFGIASTDTEATNFFTPSDDGLNSQQWFGNVYLFPPRGAYFWDKKNDKWKMTRASSPTLTSSHAVWFRKLYNSWLSNDIRQGLYFTNCPDMIRYEQKIFDFPISSFSHYYSIHLLIIYVS